MLFGSKMVRYKVHERKNSYACQLGIEALQLDEHVKANQAECTGYRVKQTDPSLRFGCMPVARSSKSHEICQKSHSPENVVFSEHFKRTSWTKRTRSEVEETRQR
ncbi:hypothetical protein J6590_059938 [Homalodisca vitripennis]|nr:hypothetical protein J6590_059938 [Homalodisca vitripennis]